MNPTLQERLDIFRSMPSVPSEAVDLVSDELARVDPAGTLTDDQAGSFVSHAVNALARLARGDDSVDPPSDGVFRAVQNEDPGAAQYAAGFAERVRSRFARDLPEPEVKFMTIHFAALRQHLAKENS